MHCEKNLCENVLKTIFGIKDALIVRKDFKECDICPHLRLQDDTGGIIKPLASHVLLDEERNIFLQVILNLKTPSHYVSLLRKKNYKDGDLKSMKSHDFHVMMQDILPLCLQHLVAKGCRMAIMCFSHVFKKLCAKIMDPRAMGDFKNDVAIFLVLLEKESSSSLFDIMTHLLVHLVE